MTYDTIIIGGGAAGLIAGVECKRLGQSFLIIERNPRPGKKLVITGKGRCNVTNHNTNLDDLVSKYQRNGKFLYGAFSRFSVEDTMKYFKDILKIPLKVERGKRVFPKSDKAVDIIYALTEQVGENILPNTSVMKFNMDGNTISSVTTYKGDFKAKKYILATGGKTYPVTGSNGDGYTLAKEIGHTITELKPALVPILCKEKYVKELAGLSLKYVTISAYQNEKKVCSKFGEALFTHEGLSGPIVIDMSREIGDALEKGEVNISIDFKPAIPKEELDKRLQHDLKESGRKNLRTLLKSYLPSSLIPIVVDLSQIPPSTQACDINREQRNTIIDLLKDFKLTVSGLESWDKAIVTSGGVSIKEIDPKTMKSKLIDNLYFAGEIIDVYGPTGGYNLQICWSTGITAARSRP
ncbi:aminoacetone oxidase family FAD-binding enzyme [Candidatus Dojkabacteria bacterium HGW-Dojkabacteria-1]|uniref:Aminoacetone oxidase family FAD-binding enzyme n=1 Tax=Candidatus Dojkabacteria bacterium HGW-Dojkabacteria-1 TaxID=2013761 RepID=A0A2N2F368_9BACT|nr:MAG: aminoacetone oxidase family FAD-binding enzyme [Candidatus Dojkabacteria bacterium HGW-Dojkabacteria-1]